MAAKSHNDEQRDDQTHASSGLGVLIGPLRKPES